MVGTAHLSRTAAIVLLSWSPVSVASQATWSATTTTGGPPPVFRLAAAYDLARSQSLVFGGFHASYAVEGRSWTFDGRDWRAATGPGPGARGAHAMVYDVLRDRIVLFGGTASALLAFGLQDTWEFDGTSWHACQPVHQPPARFDHAMTFDFTTGRALLHGGRTMPAVLLGDTWGFDGSDWVQFAGPGPSPRCRHAMSHDLVRQRTVLFGGRDTMDLADTWLWDGALWSQMVVGGPSGRNGHGLVCDLSRSLLVLHGGSQGCDETWEWNGTGWANASTGSVPRQDQAMVFDARLQRSTLVGGVMGQPFAVQADVQTYGLPVAGSFTAQGTSCAGTAGTPSLAPPPYAAVGPQLGTTSLLEASPVVAQTFFVFGMSDTNDGSLALPHDLSALGMPGCALRVSRDAVTSALPIAGTASVAIAVPNDPFLTGLQFYVQAFPLDLLANAVGFLTTNAVRASIGRN